MKFHKIIASFAIFASLIAGAATTDNSEFLKEKKFGKFSFTGCVVQVDATSGYIYFHIGSSILRTQKNQVNFDTSSGTYSQNLDSKNEIVKEYIYRQNYCSFIK